MERAGGRRALDERRGVAGDGAARGRHRGRAAASRGAAGGRHAARHLASRPERHRGQPDRRRHDPRRARGERAVPDGAAGGLPPRCIAAAARDGHGRRQPAPVDAMLVLAARLRLPAARRRQCQARDGEHREHAIFANDFCASAHPSDVAAALSPSARRVRTTAASSRLPSSTGCPRPATAHARRSSRARCCSSSTCPNPTPPST